MTLTIEDGGKVEVLGRDQLRTGTQQMMFDAGYTRAVCVGENGLSGDERIWLWEYYHPNNPCPCRVITTNGDPVVEGETGFDELWEAIVEGTSAPEEDVLMGPRDSSGLTPEHARWGVLEG